jgi:hypothetical protein
MRMGSRPATLRLLVAALWVAIAPARAAQNGSPEPAQIQYAAGRQIAQLANKEIKESSGLACSRRTGGVFWTHNDSGGGPRLFAFDAQGQHLATLHVQGALSRDWEDMASFRRRGKACLLIGDVGDNGSCRTSCTIYVVPEPPIRRKKRDVTGKIKPLRTIRFRYEDGPHNCEGVAIDPKDGTILLVSKETAPTCRVYALPWPKRPTDKVIVARAIATLAIPVTTAMDVSPDGRRAIILTYGHAYEYARRPGEKWSKAFSRKPRLIPMPPRKQGESLCYGPDGKTLYLTSEKLPTPLLEVPVDEREADRKDQGSNKQKRGQE